MAHPFHRPTRVGTRVLINAGWYETTVTVVEAPRIEIVGPDRVAAGADVDFDAALVGDLDVGGATFAWDFGDGATATGPTVRHAFADPGTRAVRLSAVLPGASGWRGPSP